MAKEGLAGSLIKRVQISARLSATLIMRRNVIGGKVKRTRINQYSLKRIAQLNGEVKARIDLCYRAGGTPIIHNEKVLRNDGTRHIIKRVT